jgi:hypothetical protein
MASIAAVLGAVAAVIGAVAILIREGIVALSYFKKTLQMQ